MRNVFNNLLVSCPNNGGLFLLHRGATYKLDNLDTTGFVIHEAGMLRALQPARLVRFESAHLDGVTSEEDFDDIHDVLMDGEFCYVVKTDTNEIIKLDQHGQEQQRWTLPGERDSWHVNCLTRWNSRLVFSAFGDLRSHKEYKITTRGLGLVQDLAAGVKLITDLSQPHSLLAVGDKLLLANSESFEIREYDASGSLIRSRTLDGYTRGLLWHEGVLFVGLSKSRNVDSGRLTHALIVALDAESWEEIGRQPLSVEEVFSIQHVSDTAIVEALAKLASHAACLLGNRINKYAADIVGLEGQVEVTEQRAEQVRLEMVAKDSLIRNKDVKIHDQGEMIRENERKIYGLLETVHGKDLHIQSREEVISVRDLEIQRRDEVIHNKEREIQSRNEIILAKDAEIRARDDVIQRLGDQMVESRADSLAREKLVSVMEPKLASQHDEIQSLGERLREKDKVIASDNDVIRRSEDRIAALTEEIRLQAEIYGRLRGESDIQARQVNEMKREADVVHSKLRALANELEVSRARVVDMESSRSWKITRPLRAIKEVLIRRRVRRFGKDGGGKIDKRGRGASNHPQDSDNGVPLPIAGSTGARTSKSPAAQNLDLVHSPIKPKFDLRGSELPIVILTTRHCTYVAEEITVALHRIGVASRIIYETPKGGYDDVPHFVICPQMFERLPNFYVSFQMEQSVSSRWFTKEYLRQLENSFAIFDYSLANIAKLENMGLYAQQIYHMPIGHLGSYRTTSEAESTEYDVIFYGDIQNARRRQFIAELSGVCKVKVINDLFGAPLHEEMARARLVVNIHYYAGALLETTRLWECLSLGKLVISERSADMDQHSDLADLIDFVDVDDIAGMVERVRYWLNNDELRLERLESNKSALQDMPNQFDAHFYRFLLATDNITFDDFWNLTGRGMSLSSDKICLNLPEYVRRSLSFDRDNRFGFVRFVGLRHDLGWVGCAMSYKLIIMLARQQGLSSLTICEDDVNFPGDFETRWAKVQEHLHSLNDNWDVFSGLLADLHVDSKILRAYESQGIQFAVTDRLISMVFNVYNKTMFDILASWDERNRDVATNTIDRYLEHNASIEVVTTLPFLVGHKEELYSTLWGFQNTQYSTLIAGSSDMLAQKVAQYL